MLGVLVVVVLLAPRRVALLGMLAGALYLSQEGSVVIVGLNVYGLRFLEIAGFVRVMGRREFPSSGLNRIDGALLLLYGYTTVVFLLRSKDGQAYQIGRAVDACLCYFTFRGLLREVEQFRKFLRDFVILLAPFVASVLMESVTAHNVFWSPGLAGNEFRAGRVRCQGSFQFSGLLGTLGATYLPMYLGLAFAKAERTLAAAGIALCLAIVWACNSGGPMCAMAFALAGWAFWPQRLKMQRVRRGMLAGVALLALVMQAPIWYIPMKVSVFTGGDGYHRSYLMDVAYQHLGEWWLVGMPVSKTAQWFPYVLPDYGTADITNEFLGFGVVAGIPAVALLIVVLTRAFKGLGAALVAVRSAPAASMDTELMLWGLGVALLAHIANWIGASYFDQIMLFFLLQLAAISTLANACPSRAPLLIAHIVLPHDGESESENLGLGGVVAP